MLIPHDALEVDTLTRLIEDLVTHVVSQGDVRVIGESTVHLHVAGTHTAFEFLARGNALGNSDEDNRRDRAEGAGSVKGEPERKRPHRHASKVLHDGGHGVSINVDGGQDGEVSRLIAECRVEAKPRLLENLPMGRRNADGHPDGVATGAEAPRHTLSIGMKPIRS